MLFLHNVNSRDLAFDYEDYDFMSHHKHTRSDENERKEGFSPREHETEKETIDEVVLMNHWSLFPKILNAMISQQEKNDAQIYKKPLIEKVGVVKTIKLLSFDLSGFDLRELFEYLQHEDTQELTSTMIAPSL